MKLRLTSILTALAMFVVIGCETPTAPLAEDSSLASQSSSLVGPATEEGGSATGKGGQAGFSTEMNQLLAQIRAASARFHRSEVAEEAGYVSTEECVINPVGPGAMGIHFINFGLTGDGTFDPLQPEVLVYEPQENGRLRLVAVEYLVFLENMTTPEVAPDLLGETFHGPSTHGLPPHYEFHAWLWRNNPDGMFAQWNPKVSCPNGEAH